MLTGIIILYGEDNNPAFVGPFRTRDEAIAFAVLNVPGAWNITSLKWLVNDARITSADDFLRDLRSK